MKTPFDLVVDPENALYVSDYESLAKSFRFKNAEESGLVPGDLPFENVTVCCFAVVTYFLVTVCAVVNVGFLRTNIATRHNRVSVRIRKLT